MSLNDRLDRLETHRPERGRCERCRDWPAFRATFPDEPHAPPTGPCPGCGFTPQTIAVEYTDGGQGA